MIPEPFTDAIWFGLAFLSALGLVLYITPLTIRVALNFKIHDTPDGRLKKHTQPTPYLGGLAVAGGFVIAFAVLSTPHTTNFQAMGILTGSFMVLLLGLYDDLTNLSPSVKFIGQLLAAAVIYKGGVQVSIFEAEWINLGLTILWVTGVANAFNIIDIMDGLAAGTAFIAALFLFAISVAVDDRQVVPFMALTLAGALLGYLRFNFNPAKIFLGDTGSLFVGFMIGSLSMLVSYSKGGQDWAVLAPIVLLSVPIFDTVFVAIHRARKGIPFFRGSPDHFALRLRNRGLSVRQVVLRVYATGLMLGALTLMLVFGGDQLVPWTLALVGLLWLAAFVVLSRMPPPGAPQPRETT